MTQPRRQLVDSSQAQMFHCIQRCVRRSWLCGLDPYTQMSFEHRKSWVEARIYELGNIFACGIYGYAIMSNHLHLVLHMSPATSNNWSAEEVARRWTKLYPAKTSELCEQKVNAILETPAGEQVRIKSAQSQNLKSHLDFWLWARLIRLRPPAGKADSPHKHCSAKKR